MYIFGVNMYIASQNLECRIAIWRVCECVCVYVCVCMCGKQYVHAHIGTHVFIRNTATPLTQLQHLTLQHSNNTPHQPVKPHNMLLHTTTSYQTLQHTATRYSMLQNTAKYIATVIYCNNL